MVASVLWKLADWRSVEDHFVPGPVVEVCQAGAFDHGERKADQRPVLSGMRRITVFGHDIVVVPLLNWLYAQVPGEDTSALNRARHSRLRACRRLPLTAGRRSSFVPTMLPLRILPK